MFTNEEPTNMEQRRKWAAESEARNFARMAARQHQADHDAAMREHQAREAARSLGMDFAEFMEAE